MARQQGYLAMLLLPMLAGLLLLMLAIFAHGEKLRVQFQQQNKVDALAYSAAVLMARELNLLALLNRALLANQLSIAQLMGIASWFEMIRSSSDRTAAVTAWVPYLNTVTHSLQRAINMVQRPLAKVLRAGITLQHGWLRILMQSQQLVRLSFASLIPQTLHDIAARYGDDTSAWQLIHAPGLNDLPLHWWSYLGRQRSGEDQGQLADLMQQSLDPFSRQRSHDWLRLGFIRVRKAGGTELQVERAGRWQWQALDTVALHLRLLWLRREIPWGDGATHLQRPIRRPSAASFGESPRRNRRTTQLALQRQRSISSAGPTMYYYHRDDLASAELPHVLVTSGTRISRAGVFFSRPQALFPRADQRQERGHLFNALWQAQLQPLQAADKVLVQWLRTQQP